MQIIFFSNALLANKVEVKFRHTHLRRTFSFSWCIVASDNRVQDNIVTDSMHKTISMVRGISVAIFCYWRIQWAKNVSKVCNMPTLYLKEKLLRIASHHIVRFIQKGAKYNISYYCFITTKNKKVYHKTFTFVY